DHASDDRLLEFEVLFVVAARLDIHNGRLAARIVGQGIGEFGRGKKDVNVLAAGDAGGCAPAARGQVGGYGGGEVTGVGVDRHRTLAQRFLGLVAAERAADADVVPGIGHAEAVGSENID